MQRLRLITLFGILISLSTAGICQTSTPTKPGLLHRLTHPLSSKHVPPSHGHPIGRIIGNKRSHVYHLPGDNQLPAEQNRVYFRSESEAVKAGYRKSGSRSTHGRSHSMKTTKPSHQYRPA